MVYRRTREALAIRVKRKLNSSDVLEALADVMIVRGTPTYIRSDNGPEFIALSAEGTLAASDLEGAKGSGGWWAWSDAKSALEWLFWTGRITTATRRASFERAYDLTERVLPAAILDRVTPSEPPPSSASWRNGWRWTKSRCARAAISPRRCRRRSRTTFRLEQDHPDPRPAGDADQCRHRPVRPGGRVGDRSAGRRQAMNRHGRTKAIATDRLRRGAWPPPPPASRTSPSIFAAPSRAAPAPGPRRQLTGRW